MLSFSALCSIHFDHTEDAPKAAGGSWARLRSARESLLRSALAMASWLIYLLAASYFLTCAHYSKIVTCKRWPVFSTQWSPAMMSLSAWAGRPLPLAAAVAAEAEGRRLCLGSASAAQACASRESRSKRPEPSAPWRQELEAGAAGSRAAWR